MPPALATAFWFDALALARREMPRAAFSGAPVPLGFAFSDAVEFRSKSTSIFAIACSFSSLLDEMDASAPAACICASSPSEPSSPTSGEMPSLTAIALWLSQCPEDSRHSAAAAAAATAEPLPFPSRELAAAAPLAAMSSSSALTSSISVSKQPAWAIKDWYSGLSRASAASASAALAWPPINSSRIASDKSSSPLTGCTGCSIATRGSTALALMMAC